MVWNATDGYSTLLGIAVWQTSCDSEWYCFWILRYVASVIVFIWYYINDTISMILYCVLVTMDAKPMTSSTNCWEGFTAKQRSWTCFTSWNVVKRGAPTWWSRIYSELIPHFHDDISCTPKKYLDDFSWNNMLQTWAIFLIPSRMPMGCCIGWWPKLFRCKPSSCWSFMFTSLANSTRNDASPCSVFFRIRD